MKETLISTERNWIKWESRNKMLASKFQDILRFYLGESIQLISYQSISGGCIHEAFELKTNQGLYFLKYHASNPYIGMFEIEARGLELLRNACTIIHVPEVIAVGKDYLLLSYIQRGSSQENSNEKLGEGLAELHQVHHQTYGFESDNYIGTIAQSNEEKETWKNFFWENRIQYQLNLATRNGLIFKDELEYFDCLCHKLDDILPITKPSLIHGDLWSGNYCFNQERQPCIFDPAVYYGSREMDISMSKLFGGFSPKFYEAYQYHYPMEKAWEDRVALNNLYPLLVHVNLFGSSYLSQVHSILKDYGCI